MSGILTRSSGSGSVVSASSILEFQTGTTTVQDTETQIFSFVNSTGSDLFINQITGEGDARSEWFIYINDVLKKRTRSSVSDLNIECDMFNFPISDTDTVKVKVSSAETGTSSYSTTLNYHD